MKRGLLQGLLLSARWQLISNLFECVCDHWLIVYLNAKNRCFLVSTPITRTIGRLNENTQIFHSRKFLRAKSLKIVHSRKFMRAKCTICSFAKVYARESLSRESFCARKFLHLRYIKTQNIQRRKISAEIYLASI